MRYLLSLALTTFVFSYTVAGDSLETRKHHFSSDKIGNGLNSEFSLTIGTHDSYAARLVLAPYYEWQEQHDQKTWPLIKKGEYLRPVPERYVKEVRLYADKLFSRVKLHPRVIYYSYDLPSIPDALKAKVVTNEGRTASATIHFARNLQPIRPGFPSPRKIDFRHPAEVSANRRFIFMAQLSPFANGNYFGATLIYRCQPTQDDGPIVRLQVKMKQHKLYSPGYDSVLVNTELRQAVYRMSLINKVNLDRKLTSAEETDKVTFVATCTTKSGQQYQKEQDVIIKSLYNGNPGSSYYNPYDHVNIH